jgi:hypothetical protein
MRMRGRTVGVLAPCEAHASRAREAGKGRPGRVAEAATERAGRRGREGGREGGRDWRGGAGLLRPAPYCLRLSRLGGAVGLLRTSGLRAKVSVRLRLRLRAGAPCDESEVFGDG